MKMFSYFIVVMFLGAVLDAVMKWLVVGVHFVWGWLTFSVVYNQGVALSLPLPWLGAEILGIAIIITIIFYVYYLARNGGLNYYQATAWGLVCGGGVGNLVDRSIDTRVIDFIHLGSLPVANGADYLIMVGIVMLFFVKKY